MDFLVEEALKQAVGTSLGFDSGQANIKVLGVGGAGNNMVPCHRVVDSKGYLHGFAHGLKRKAELLKNEGIKVKDYKIVDFKKRLFDEL